MPINQKPSNKILPSIYANKTKAKKKVRSQDLHSEGPQLHLQGLLKFIMSRVTTRITIAIILFHNHTNVNVGFEALGRRHILDSMTSAGSYTRVL